MTSTIYGAELITSPQNGVNFDGGAMIGKNSEVFTAGDPVTNAGTNGLQVAGTTDKVYGIVQKTQTMSSSNQTVAKVKPVCLAIDENYEFIMGCNADLAELTSVGTYYKLTTATTGAVQVDVTSGAQTGNARVVVCTGVDPLNEGGTGAGSGLRKGKFRFVKVFNIQADQTSA